MAKRITDTEDPSVEETVAPVESPEEEAPEETVAPVKKAKAEKKEEARPLTAEEQKAIDRIPVNINQIAADTKAILDKRPKVSIMLPLEPGEKKGAYDTARINGYRYQVLKGAMVMVPDCVAELFAEKYNIALNAGSEKRLDNVPEELS